MYNAVFFGVSGTSSQSVANSATFIINLSPALWLDAADTSTLTVTNDAVSQWRDKSTNLRHASQTTGTSQPIYNPTAVNGLGSLVFTWDSLEVPGLVLTGLGWHVYAVASLSGGNANGRLLSLSGSGGTDWNNNSSWVVLFRRSTTNSIISVQGNIYTTDNAINFNQMYIFGSTYTSTGRSILTNGVVTGSAANASSALNTTLGARIGRSFNAWDGDPPENWNGTISEIIVTPELSNSDRQAIEGYLAWKWGLVASLPSSHPYKNTAPTFTLLSITANNTIAVLQLNQPTALTFTVNRSGALTGQTTVNYVVSGTGSSPAVASEFGGTFPSGSVTFASNETIKTISVTVTINSTVPMKEFTVTLSNAVNGDILNGAAVSKFTDNFVLGLSPALWLDAADPSTLTISNTTNNTVSQWRDKTGNARNANQVSGGNQPVYIAGNTPGLYFNGSTSQMIYPGGLAAPYSIFIVFNINRPSIAGQIITLTGSTATGVGDVDDAGSNGPFVSYSNNNFGIFTNGNGFASVNFPYSSSLEYPSENNRLILSSHFQSANHRLTINGATASTSAGTHVITMFSSMSLGFQVVSGRHVLGTIHEVIILQGKTITQWEQESKQLEGYLAWKWGIVNSLPSNHPYKNTPPF